MKIRWWAFVAAFALVACSSEDDAAVADEPEPVAPLEVSAATGGEASDDDVAALQARVAELEGQLEQQGEVEPTTPESADIPDGVDAPAQPAVGSPSDEEDEEAQSSEETEGSTRRRRRDRDDDILLNPLDILLGE